jgi:putative ABC transport system permease protein
MAQDLRLALRLLLKNPGFSLVVLTTLALAIGANTAIFSVVDGVLLRRAPVDDINRLVMAWETDRRTETQREPASVPDYLDFVARSRTIQTLAAFAGGEASLSAPGGEPVRLALLRTTYHFLPMMGIAPSLGRGFTEEEDRPNGPRVAMISQSLWERAFGSDPGVVGRTARLDEQPYEIVGVVPDAADFGVLQILSAAAYSRGFADRGERSRVDVWIPLQADPQRLPRSTHPIFMLGRLAPGHMPASAQQELGGIAADLERAYPNDNADRGLFVEPLKDVVFGPIRPALFVLLGAVAIVLLVAAVNVANLLLARGTNRMREVAVRTALGAGGRRLARQFLLESLVLTLVAAAAGVLLAVVGLKTLIAIAPSDIPRLTDVSLDLRVLGVTLAVSLVVAVVFSLLPTFQARSVDLQSTLKDESWHGSGGRSRTRLRGALVVAELAMAVVLLVAAGLLIKSFWRLIQVDPGFQTAGVLKAEYQLPSTRYPTNFQVFPNFKEIHAFTGALVARAQALPGVESAGIAGNHPLDPGFTNSFTIVGRESEARNWPEISVRRVTPGYFRTVGLSLVRGRLLAESDTTEAPPVALLNQAAVRRFFPSSDPIGARIRFWGTARTIVGVVNDEHFQGLDEAAPIAVYAPLTQAPSGNGVLLVRTTGDPLSQAAAVRGAIREIDSGLAVYGVEPLTQTVSRSVSERRFAMVLLSLFAGLALTLAAVGIHGVLSYRVSQRTREIGIRMALGAQPSGVRRLVVGEGIVLTLVGLAIGLAGALAVTRVMGALLYDVSAADLPTFSAAAVFLGLVAAVASYLPARRATNVDPIEALRGIRS